MRYAFAWKKVKFLKYDSIRSLSVKVSRLIKENDLDQALRLIHDLVERIFTEPLCTSQVFGSKTLDDLCQGIGKANLAEINQGNVKPTSRQADKPVFIYIVTKLQNSGGHTRVIENFIKAQPMVRHVILSTELEGRSDVGYLINGLVKQAKIVFEQAPKANYKHRLTWLQKRLIELKPRKVYLFNHHQDSVATAATQPEMKLDVSFYHHGDHHLCLGVYLSHLRHIDPHPMGYHNCRDVLGIENIYVPLTIEDKGARSSGLPFLSDGQLTTCTVARSNKIEIPYFTSYLDLVPKLLRARGGSHIHIGQLTPWALFKIRRGLKHQGIAPERFIYMPWVLSVWKALHDYRVDLYISSFPYGGGLTLIEAMGAGIPIALHRHIFSRFLSGIDLAYPGVFSWRQPEELLDYCASLTPGDLIEAGRLSRMQYQKFHSNDNLKEILKDSVCECPKPNELSGNYFVESDEWALWMERQLSIKRIFSRAAYRALKRFRVWW